MRLPKPPLGNKPHSRPSNAPPPKRQRGSKLSNVLRRKPRNSRPHSKPPLHSRRSSSGRPRKPPLSSRPRSKPSSVPQRKPPPRNKRRNRGLPRKLPLNSRRRSKRSSAPRQKPPHAGGRLRPVAIPGNQLARNRRHGD